MLIIGIDLGTTGCKAALYDKSGRCLSEYNEEYSLIASEGYVEQDANEWWRMVKNAVAFVANGYNDKITAICLSTQGISVVPVDKEGEPLCNAISWLDMRAVYESQRLEAHFGAEKIYSKTGKPISAAYTLPKLMWIKTHRPKIYKNAYKFLMPLDFINFKLIGNGVTDRSMASGTMLYNINENKWDGELIEFSGICEDKLPEVQKAGEVLGSVNPNVAQQLGIPSSTAVILGGQDQKLAAIGAGISEGVCTVSIGTATAISRLNPPAGIGSPLFAFDDGKIFAEESIATTGAAIKWLSGILGEGYKTMDSLASSSSTGAGGVSFDIGMTEGGVISGLTLASTKGDIIRALYEGICKEIQSKIVKMGGANEICVFGGGAKSEILCHCLREKTGLVVRALDTPEAASKGAAVLALEHI